MGGGAVGIGAVAAVQIENGIFENNTSAIGGGAIDTRSALAADNTDAALDITKSTFKGNTASQTAGEGGAWGIALLADYMVCRDSGETLEDYLNNRVFADMKGNTVSPKSEDVDGINKYMKNYLSGLASVRAAVSEKQKG